MIRPPPSSTLFPYTTLFRSWQSPLRRMMGYLTNLMTTDVYNKEVKLFTLGDFFIERFSNLFQRYYGEMRALVIRRYLRSEEHTSELQSRFDLVCRLLLEKKK